MGSVGNRTLSRPCAALVSSIPAPSGDTSCSRGEGAYTHIYDDVTLACSGRSGYAGILGPLGRSEFGDQRRFALHAIPTVLNRDLDWVVAVPSGVDLFHQSVKRNFAI